MSEELNRKEEEDEPKAVPLPEVKPRSLVVEKEEEKKDEKKE